MLFELVSWPTRSRQPAAPRLLLRKERWDDFGHQVLFRAWLVPAVGIDPIELGRVKILQVGERTPQLPDVFDAVPQSCMSQWQSADAYASLRDHGVFDDVTSALRDLGVVGVGGVDADLLEKTLLRSPAARLASAGVPLAALQLDILLDGFESEHNLALTFGPGLRRMGVLVGENGVGKSRLLAALMKLVSGEVWSASHLSGVLELTKFEANFPGGVLAIAYGAFDPFVHRAPPRAISSRAATYVGLRHRGALDEERAVGQAVEAVRSFAGSPRMQRDWRRALEVCPDVAADLPEIDPWLDVTAFSNALARTSSGRQVALMTISAVIAYLQAGQLVLFDEPETHLHPGLLTGVLTVLHELLEQRASFALLATHSVLPVQAALREQVRIVRMEGRHPIISEPAAPTFGANCTALLGEVYDVSPSARLYGLLLRDAVARHGVEKLPDPDGLALAAALLLDRLRDVEP